MKRQVDICYTFFLFPQFSHTTTKYRISICPAMVLCQVQQSPVLMPSISSSICLQGSAITVGPQARSSSLQSPFWPPIFPLSFNSLWCTPAVKISTASKQVRLSRVANYKVRKKKKKGWILLKVQQPWGDWAAGLTSTLKSCPSILRSSHNLSKNHVRFHKKLQSIRSMNSHHMSNLGLCCLFF